MERLLKAGSGGMDGRNGEKFYGGSELNTCCYWVFYGYVVLCLCAISEESLVSDSMDIRCIKSELVKLLASSMTFPLRYLLWIVIYPILVIQNILIFQGVLWMPFSSYVEFAFSLLQISMPCNSTRPQIESFVALVV